MTDLQYTTDPTPMHGNIKYRDDYVGMRFGHLTVIGYHFAFRDWVYSHGFDDDAPKYQCSIDRINPFGDYEPSNCRWADSKTQNNNKRAHWLRSHGVTA